MLHSVPEFPRVYKTNPSGFIKHLLCAKVFYSCLVPQPALGRLELVSSPPFTVKQRRPDEGQRLVPQLLGEGHAARPRCGPCQQGSLNAVWCQIQLTPASPCRGVTYGGISELFPIGRWLARSLCPTWLRAFSPHPAACSASSRPSPALPKCWS